MKSNLLASWKYCSQHLLSNPRTIIFLDSQISPHNCRAASTEPLHKSPETLAYTTKELFSPTKGTNVSVCQVTCRIPSCKILVIRFIICSSYPLLKRFSLKLFCWNSFLSSPYPKPQPVCFKPPCISLPAVR